MSSNGVDLEFQTGRLTVCPTSGNWESTGKAILLTKIRHFSSKSRSYLFWLKTIKMAH